MSDAIVQGILLGGYYAILAAGLSLMFGVVRFINLAHGDIAVLAAMMALYAVERLGLPMLAAIAVTVPLMGAVGYGLQALIFERALKGGFLVPILTTIGLGAALQNAMFGIFGSDTKSLGAHIGALSWSGWTLPGGIIVGKLPVYTFVTALVLLTALHLMLTRTALAAPSAPPPVMPRRRRCAASMRDACTAWPPPSPWRWPAWRGSFWRCGPR